MKICKDGRIWGQMNTDYHNPEYIKKQRESHLGSKNGRWKGGKSKGYILPKGIKKGWNPKSGMGTRFKKGKNNPSWKGGVTSLNKQVYKLLEYKQWRSNVYQRDNWTCQTCGKRGGLELESHHIKAFSQIIAENHIITVWEAQLCKELWDINNGVTLCKECHKLTKNYGEKSEGRK